MNLNQTGRLVAAASMIALLSGCSLTFDASTLGVDASVSQAAGQDEQGTDFEVSKKAVYLFFGILRVANPSLEHVLAGQLVDGTEVRNLSVKVRSRFADILVSALTLGLIVPRSVTYTGTVISGNGNP